MTYKRSGAMSLVLSRPWLYAVAFPLCLIVLQVFIDLAYGTLGGAGRAGLFSIGVIFRGGLSLIAILLLLKLRAAPLKVFLFAFLAIFLLSNLVWALASDVYSFAHELNQGMKVAFPWLVAGIFLYLHQRAPIDRFYLLTLLAWAGFLSALSVLGATALGIGRETYGAWSYGSKGLFNAQNDLGLTLVLTLVAAVVVLVRTRKVLYLVMTASIASAGLLLGTRTGVLGPLAVVLAFGSAAVLNPGLFSPFDGRRGWQSTAVLILPLVLVLAVAVGIFSQSEKTDYLIKRIQSLSEQTPRSKLEAAGIERLRERGVILTLVGEGGLAFKKHVAENIGFQREKIDQGAMASMGESKKLPFPVHRVENDVIDVLGFYGIAQFAVIYGALAILYLLTLRKAVRAWNIENVALLLILTLFLVHSSLAGHGLFGAQVGTVLAPVVFLQIRDLRWGRAVEEAAPGVDARGTLEGPSP